MRFRSLAIRIASRSGMRCMCGLIVYTFLWTRSSIKIYQIIDNVHKTTNFGRDVWTTPMSNNRQISSRQVHTGITGSGPNEAKLNTAGKRCCVRMRPSTIFDEWKRMRDKPHRSLWDLRFRRNAAGPPIDTEFETDTDWFAVDLRRETRIILSREIDR